MILFLILFLLHSVTSTTDCNYAQYKFVRGAGYGDIYPFDVCFTTNLLISGSIASGSVVYSCINGTGFNTAYASADCTGTIYIHSPLNTGQFDIYCNQSSNCPYVRYNTSSGHVSTRVINMCFGHADSSDLPIVTFNYSQHICTQTAVFDVHYTAANGGCSGSYEIDVPADDLIVLECTEPVVDMLPTRAPVYTPTTATPTQHPTQRLATDECNYVQLRWYNGGASIIYPIDVCITSIIASNNGHTFESYKYTCVDGVAYKTNRWITADCTGEQNDLLAPGALPTQPAYTYYSYQCAQTESCPSVVYEYDDSGTSVFGASVTGVCYDCRGWEDVLETREWCQNICNENGYFQAVYGVTNGNCSGQPLTVEQVYEALDIHINSCSRPIEFALPTSTELPTSLPVCNDPESFSSNGVSCDWYLECLQATYGCAEDEYPLDYGYYFCDQYGQAFSAFSWSGQLWINQVKLCLQNALLPKQQAGDGTCAELKEFAFSTHAACYLGTNGEAGSLSICDLEVDDLMQIFGTVFTGLLSLDGICQVYDIVNECLVQHIQLFDIVFDANYNDLQRQLFDAAIDVGVFSVALLKELALNKLSVTIQVGTHQFEVGLDSLVSFMNICQVGEGSVITTLSMFANNTYANISQGIRTAISDNIGASYEIRIEYLNQTVTVSDFVMSDVVIVSDDEEEQTDMDTSDNNNESKTSFLLFDYKSLFVSLFAVTLF